MKNIFLLFVICLCKIATGAITFPSIIGNHMVLQQKTTITLWGWCDPSEEIKIKTGWDTTTFITKGDNVANWKISLPTPEAGGPYSISFSGYETVTLTDIMIGEVWLCGGQSNMAFSGNNGIKQAIEEVPNANNNSIRFFSVEKSGSNTLQNNCKGEWKVCTPEEMKRFSAVGYFFGKKLQNEMNIPVGLIGAYWGGTPAEVWAPAELIEQDSLLRQSKGKLWSSDEWWPVQPGICYNAMIYPVSHFTIAGVIWYQGESNTDAAFTYEKLFSTLIHSWRKAWQMELPFYYVQIAPSAHYQGHYSGALLREAQTRCLAIPNTGMVVIHDLITDINDIHPQNKKTVGIRLANYALSEQYHKAGIPCKSPIFKQMQLNGNKAVISFSNVLTGLKAINGNATGFLIAGEDKLFLLAEATISGEKIIVYNKKIRHPTAVRFAFTNTGIPNLFTNEGLPVTGFRTDSWEIKP